MSKELKSSRRDFIVGLAASSAAIVAANSIGGHAFAQAAPAKVSGAPIKLRYGHSQPVGHSTDQAANRFVEIIKERTNGEVLIDLFPNNQLGVDRELQMMIETGQLDFTHSNSATMGNFLPEIGVMNLPFIWQSYEHYFRVVDGPFSDQLNEQLANATGHRYLAWWFDGFRHVYTADRAVNQLSDIQGLKIRAPESKVFVDTFRALGANPTPLAFPEIYTGLEAGVIDGFEGANGIVYTSKVYEVAKNRAATSHIMLGFGLTTSSPRFAQLPSDVQDIVLEAAREAQDLQRQVQLAEEDGLVEKMIADGVQETKPDLAEFREACTAVHEEFRSTHDVDAFFDLISAAA